MKIERFQEEDMNVVKPLAKQAWHTFYDGFSEDYLLCIAECIVRHNFTDADLSLKISDEEGVKGLIFGTRKGKIVDLSDWVKKQSENLSPIEKDLLETLCEYMDEADRNTLARMSDEDVKLSLFVSTRKGCGRELLNPSRKSSANTGFGKCSFGRIPPATMTITQPMGSHWRQHTVTDIIRRRKKTI